MVDSGTFFSSAGFIPLPYSSWISFYARTHTPDGVSHQRLKLLSLVAQKVFIQQPVKFNCTSPQVLHRHASVQGPVKCVPRVTWMSVDIVVPPLHEECCSQLCSINNNQYSGCVVSGLCQSFNKHTTSMMWVS